MTLLLDTSCCVEILRGRPLALDRLEALSPDDVALSAMTCAELRFGALRGRRGPMVLERLERFLAAFDILPFDAPAAAFHAEVRLTLGAAGQPIGERDLIIAATALAHGCDVATGNLREFTRVPGLRVESWG